jgi:LPS-assembly protein
VQRIRFSPQRVTPDGEVQSQRFSDVLLTGSTTLLPAWTLDASVQYSPDVQGISRSVLSARYSPGPYRTVNATYRQNVGESEQVEFGWQWPIAGPTRDEIKPRSALGTTPSSGSCGGTWYTVGRINYNLNESRVTDAVLGIEYDAGCWIGRMVAERLSTGRSEATTRVLFQLELVGLSRLGSSPVQVLKDNIPGYRMLRDDRGPTGPLLPYD